LSRQHESSAVVMATQAILYFMLAFACDDEARNIRGKLPRIEYWKTTCDFIQWVINLQKERSENELEGLWYGLFEYADLVTNYMRFANNGYLRMNYGFYVGSRGHLSGNGSKRTRNRLNPMKCFGGHGQIQRCITLA
jgi:hypothetical protein